MERISTLMTQSLSIASVESDLERMTATQQQLSSGKQINQPSDDPFGAAQALDLTSTLSGIGDNISNVNDGTAWLQATDGALSSMNNSVQRARELLVEGANGTLSSSELGSTAQEIDQLIESVKSDANAKYANQYVFSGTATTTSPYGSGTAGDTFQGNTSTVTRLIGPGVQIPVNIDLSSLLGSGTAAGDGKLLDVLRTASADLRSGNQAAIGTDLKNLDANMDVLSGLQATTGALSDRFQLASTRLSSLQVSTSQMLSNTTDIDYAQATSTYSTQQLAYQAALKVANNIEQTALQSFLSSGGL
jgi:flagellar hook-associated protein 3 FlgL